ncbi:hypothetical protein [Nitrospira sp. KM1]|uniref:[protein-PII] uridylyltransferase family protein n=1 Tax=Nitrospira sp. KM1 TaxID=1936990 RepID=UPI001E5D6BF2|nr:hypothetical protein [Nitrospira sp. KM1]
MEAPQYNAAMPRPNKPRAVSRTTPAPSFETSKPDPLPLLLAAGLEPGQAEGILRPYGFRSVAEADANLQAMAGDPHTRRQLAEILAPMLEAVSRTADPDQALNHWERLLNEVNRSGFLDYVRQLPRMLDVLCTIFGNSDALSFALIRDPALVYWLGEVSVLEKPSTRTGMEQELEKSLRSVQSPELKLEALRRFRRREMLRIGVRDLLRLSDVPATTAALSDAAAVLIDAAYRTVDTNLKVRYGTPMHKNRSGKWVETRFVVIGMGKLGAGELNYSSDVDLIYVYESLNGETRTARRSTQAGLLTTSGISNEEYFEMLSRDLTKALTEQTKEGSVFRVDLRLRAEGTVGRLARSLEDYDRYYKTRGQVWERLALLKSSPIAGSVEVGRAFMRIVHPFVFGDRRAKPDTASALKVIEDVRSVKDMIDAKMAGRGHERRNVKLGVGGIREIEFLVQTIQTLAGRAVPALMDRSTLGGLKRFAAAKLISPQERDALIAAYIFLRDVEHKLQMVLDLQTHALPDELDELERCAIRMGYGESGRSTARRRFAADHDAHTAVVHEFFKSLFYEPGSSSLLKATLRAIKGGR